MTDQDWKSKYYTLEQKLKSELAQSTETEQLLCRTIIRLTLATKGLDPALDPHLIKLRDTLKKGVNENVHRHIAAISEALMRAHDEPIKEELTESSNQSELFGRLLAHTHLSGKKGKRLRELGEQIVSDPATASDDILDEFIRLLAEDAKSDNAKGEKGPGILGRIFSKNEQVDGSSEDSEEPMNLLLSLLAKLNWPSQLSRDISTLKKRLEKHDHEAVVDVINHLAKIVSSLLDDINKETRETGSFLADLMAQLQELDQYVVNGQVLQQQSLQSGKELDRAVQEQVSDIAISVRDASDLQVLKEDVSSHLVNIKGHMDRHLKMAEERFKVAVKNEKKLRKRLQEVEGETSILRHKILEAQARSSMDAVTGLPNRAAYDERIKDEYKRWLRFKSPLILMVWDLDDFKMVNDRYGHQAGDKALRIIGQILIKRLRQTDFVGRYGGEEFCVLLSGATVNEAATVAEQIRQSVEKSGFHSANKPVTLTISCGYTEFREGDTPDSAFSRADSALYKAKGEGKNRCISC